MTNPNIESRARQFIDDIVKINAEHGIRTVEFPGWYEAAVAKAARDALKQGGYR